MILPEQEYKVDENLGKYSSSQATNHNTWQVGSWEVRQVLSMCVIQLMEGRGRVVYRGGSVSMRERWEEWNLHISSNLKYLRSTNTTWPKGPTYFLSSLPLLPPATTATHTGNLSTLIYTVWAVRACLSIWLERFREPLSIQILDDQSPNL